MGSGGHELPSSCAQAWSRCMHHKLACVSMRGIAERQQAPFLTCPHFGLPVICLALAVIDSPEHPQMPMLSSMSMAPA